MNTITRVSERRKLLDDGLAHFTMPEVQERRTIY
jgi:hypothetical protein